MPLACRFCLGSSSASSCSVIMENWRCFTVTGQILDGHLDKPGPFGVGEVWTNPQRLRIWLETFPKYTTFLRYRNKLPLSFPSCGFTAPVGSPAMCSSEPSHAHVCAQHRGGSGCPFPGETARIPRRAAGEAFLHAKPFAPAPPPLRVNSRGRCQQFPWVCSGAGFAPVQFI